jgi:hypothetical protein
MVAFSSPPNLGLNHCFHATLENFVALIYFFSIPYSAVHLIWDERRASSLCILSLLPIKVPWNTWLGNHSLSPATHTWTSLPSGSPVAQSCSVVNLTQHW